MAEEIAKRLPYHPDAERAVLGAVLLEDAVKVLSLVREEDFFLTENRLVFRAIKKLVGTGGAVDILTVTIALEQTGILERAGGGGYVASLADGVPLISHPEHYALTVRADAKRRELIHLGEEIQRLAWDENSGLEIERILATAVDSTLKIAARDDAGVAIRSWSEVAGNAVDEIERAHREPGSARRFRFGLNDLDALIGGLRPKELVIIVAPTSNGKTLLASQCAIQADRDGFQSLYFSAEMRAEEIVLREIAFRAGVKFYYVRRPETLNAEELKRLRQASEGKCGVQFVDRDVTPLRVRVMSEAAKKTRGLDIVFVDYDQLVIEAGIDPKADDDNVFRYQRAFVLAAKNLAARLDVCVVLLCQLRKIPTKIAAGVHPHADDIWGDSSVRNTPHMILWVTREFFAHRMDLDYERKANVYVLKNRNDRTGIVQLDFDPERVRFLDAPSSEETQTAPTATPQPESRWNK